jgi:hypothetical protein
MRLTVLQVPLKDAASPSRAAARVQNKFTPGNGLESLLSKKFNFNGPPIPHDELPGLTVQYRHEVRLHNPQMPGRGAAVPSHLSHSLPTARITKQVIPESVDQNQLQAMGVSEARFREQYGGTWYRTLDTTIDGEGAWIKKPPRGAEESVVDEFEKATHIPTFLPAEVSYPW